MTPPGTGPGALARSGSQHRRGVSPMVRKLFGVLAMAVVLCLGAVLADEITGTVMKVNKDKKEITVKDDNGKETTYTYTDDVKVSGGGGRGGKGGKGGGGGGK